MLDIEETGSVISYISAVQEQFQFNFRTINDMYMGQA